MKASERTIHTAAGAVADEATAGDAAGRSPARSAAPAPPAAERPHAEADESDERLRRAIGRRLRRVEGQVRGIERMVDLGRPTTEVITQVRAATAGLRAVARESLRRHLRQRLRDAGSHEGPGLEQAVEELLDDYHKLSR